MVPARSLLSGGRHQLEVPHTRRPAEYSKFQSAAAFLWNQLPEALRAKSVPCSQGLCSCPGRSQRGGNSYGGVLMPPEKHLVWCLLRLLQVSVMLLHVICCCKFVWYRCKLSVVAYKNRSIHVYCIILVLIFQQ